MSNTREDYIQFMDFKEPFVLNAQEHDSVKFLLPPATALPPF